MSVRRGCSNPYSILDKNRNIIGKLKTLQAASVESLSKNFKNLIQKLNLWELLQQILAEKTGMPSPPKTLITILPSRLTSRSLTTIASNQLKTYPLHTKLVSLVMLLTFAVVFVIPLTIFEELHAQSVPTLGSTKQFASDELKPYVDAAKAGSNDTGTFLNTVTNGEQVIEAAW
ncbi:hypothetical protein LEP1GSC068_0479, partial [Leptospira sp. Fiocruz LV3954]